MDLYSIYKRFFFIFKIFFSIYLEIYYQGYQNNPLSMNPYSVYNMGYHSITYPASGNSFFFQQKYSNISNGKASTFYFLFHLVSLNMAADISRNGQIIFCPYALIERFQETLFLKYF
jgi:hypothetical protein